MIPAQCTACGETVLSLSRAFFQFSLTTECQSCRRKVRKRGGWGEIFAIFFFAGLILYAASGSADRNWIWGGALVFAFYMQWWSWRSVPWDVDEPEVTG